MTYRNAPEFGADGRDREVGEQYGDVLGHQRPGERVRLDAIARTFDAQTRQRLEAVGVAADWSCLEVGAGTGTIAHWLAGQCPRGRVTATDLDVTLVQEPVPGNLTVLVHDIANDTFSEGSFDLIHARAVLMHLPQREQIVARMLEWLVPGGVLVLEELVHFPRHGLPAASPFRRVIDAWWDFLSASFGMDDAWGGRAPQVMRDAGYEDVQVAADLPAFHAGSPIAQFSRLTVLSVAPRLIAAGMLSEADVRAGLEEIDDPGHLSFPIAVIATSGRRPGS
ncbi:methyltransferase domain-containing protein [Streptomyces sp. NPDC048352]|uniref:methyltransferase domain-containing protein n=1 Tax=Streptomyces sp. NPDC048352 TaxID=3154718 RepID=UPI00343DFBBD